MKSLATLMCGAHAEGTAKLALSQLACSIESFGIRANQFLTQPVTEDTLALAPFCARVVLENSYAALVGRLDPFRMLYLAEFQAQPEYEPGKRARSAFSWYGDVMPDDKLPPLWSIENDVPKIGRALFAKHLDHLYWKPAVEGMLDYLSNLPADPIVADLLTIDAETFLGETKGRSAQLYSTLSKSVHWEFFTNALLFDGVTVQTSIRDMFQLVSRLGLVSHFVPTAYAALQPNAAVDHYFAFRELVP